jgi:branched-chain amino acid transport system permease protein
MSDVVLQLTHPTSAAADRERHRRKFGPYLQVLVVMGLLTLFPHIGLANRQVHLAVVCLIWSMAAYGLFVPYAFAGQMTVAIVTAWGVGAFTTAIAIKYWHWTFPPSLSLAMVASFIAGLMMAMPIFRTKGHYFVIVTFVIAQAVTVAAGNWRVTVGDSNSGINISDPIRFLGWNFAGRMSVFYLSLAVVTIMALSAVFIRESHFGKLLSSIRENEELARSLGVATTRLKVLALGVGGLYAGVAGTFYVYYLKHIDINSFGVPQAITLILILVVGGRRSILGPIAGAAIAYFLPEVIHLEPNRLLIAYGVALGLVVIFLPNGVLGALSGASGRVAKYRDQRRTPANTEVV